MIGTPGLFRDLKHVLDLRPIYYRKEERIRAISRSASCPGASRGRRDHHRRHLATAPPRAGAHASGRVRRPRRRITQRTETTPRQRELRALEIKKPQLALDVQARPGAPLTAPASV